MLVLRTSLGFLMSIVLGGKVIEAHKFLLAPDLADKIKYFYYKETKYYYVHVIYIALVKGNPWDGLAT